MNVTNNAPIDMLSMRGPGNAMTANERKLAAMAKLAENAKAQGTNKTESFGNAAPLNSKAMLSMAGTAATQGLGIAQGEADPLTVKGLMEAWGEKGSAYDLNGDGTVGMPDLIELISRMATEAKTAPADPMQSDPILGAAVPETISLSDQPAVIPEQVPAGPGQMSPEGLMEAWGEKGSQYDLDGDGIVGMQDLIALLSRLAGTQGESKIGEEAVATAGLGNAAPEQVTLSDAVPDAPAEAPGSNTPLTLKGLMQAWGERDSQYDLSGDGVVNMQDLIALLSQLGGAKEQGEAPLAEIITAMGTPANRAPHASQEAPTRRIAESLFDRLKASGFEQNPPTNIHQLVAGLKLAPSREQSLMNHLSSQYPHGLGVNFVG